MQYATSIEEILKNALHFCVRLLILCNNDFSVCILFVIAFPPSSLHFLFILSFFFSLHRRCFCFSPSIFLDLFVRAFAFCIVRCARRARSARRVMYICCRCRLPSYRSLGVCVCVSECRYIGYNQKAPTKFKCAIFYLNLIHWCSRSLYFSLYCPRQLFLTFHLDTQNHS